MVTPGSRNRCSVLTIVTVGLVGSACREVTAPPNRRMP